MFSPSCVSSVVMPFSASDRGGSKRIFRLFAGHEPRGGPRTKRNCGARSRSQRLSDAFTRMLRTSDSSKSIFTRAVIADEERALRKRS